MIDLLAAIAGLAFVLVPVWAMMGFPHGEE